MKRGTVMADTGEILLNDFLAETFDAETLKKIRAELRRARVAATKPKRRLARAR